MRERAARQWCAWEDTHVSLMPGWQMHRLAEIPAVLVHGRHDVSSPLDTGWRLHEAWPRGRLVVADDAGHGGGGFADAT